VLVALTTVAFETVYLNPATVEAVESDANGLIFGGEGGNVEDQPRCYVRGASGIVYHIADSGENVVAALFPSEE